MPRVLFVCTGTIFRSLTAEYGLRGAIGSQNDTVVESPGSEDFPHVVSPLVSDYLLLHGLDVSQHRRRTLKTAILDPAEVVIA